MIAVAPAAAIFLFAEWLVLRGEASYTAVLSFGGVICATLCAGVFPVLMLAAARRKGDLLPTVVYRALGHPYLLGAIYALFLVAIVLHGLVVWQAPALRAGALTVAGAVVVLTVAVVRRGAFAPRAVIAIRHDPARGELAAFSVLNGGRPAPAGVDLEQATEGRSLAAAVGTLPAAGRARFRLPATPARDLKVIAQRIGEAGTEGLPVVVRVDAGDGVIQRLDPRPGGGQLLTPLRGLPSIVEFLPADEHDEEGGDHPRRPARG